MESSNDYVRAYEKAKQELNDLLIRQKEIGFRIVVVRQSLETLAALSDSEGIQIEPSAEAVELLENSTLADEIRAILTPAYPAWLRPGIVKDELTKLGRDLSKYKNPQSTIHMVLRRMAESGEVQETTLPDEGKKVYRCVPRVPSLNDPENPLYKSGMRPFPKQADGMSPAGHPSKWHLGGIPNVKSKWKE
jgi:hypothetical protein